MENNKVWVKVGDIDFTGEQIIEKHIVPRLEEIKKADGFSIGPWEEPYGTSNLQKIIDYMVENKEYFENIEEFRAGEMEYEEAMLSEIEQGDYSEFLKTFKNLKSFSLKGRGARFGENLCHEKLEDFSITATGMSAVTLDGISKAKLPSLKMIDLYFGSEGFGEAEKIRALLENESIRNVEFLGLVNSENEDLIVKILFEEGHIDEFKNLKKLDLSHGVLTDKSGKILLENSERVNRLEKLFIEDHGIIDEDLINDLRDEYDHLEITDECIDYEEDDEGNIEYYDLPIFTE